MRPFEIGDLVVTKNNGNGVIIGFDEYNKYIIVALPALTQWGSNERGYYDVEHGNNYSRNNQTDFNYYKRCKIKHIRKPRNGSKEARDIVAMLGREFKNSLFELGYMPKSEGWYKAWSNHDYYHAKAFYNSKSMLHLSKWK